MEHFHVYKALTKSHVIQFFEARKWEHSHFREENNFHSWQGATNSRLENKSSHVNSKRASRTQLCSSVRVNYVRLSPSQENMLLIPEFCMLG